MEYAGARGKAAFARELGISSSTYDYYESKRVPPADVLVRIADLTRVDLRWLLTGEERATGAPAGHPAVVRAAELLRDHPQYATALAAFVDLLAETAGMFPAGRPEALIAGAAEAAAGSSEPLTAAAMSEAVQAERRKRTAGRSAADLVAGIAPAGGPPAAAGEPVEAPDPQEHQGWIPILGRSAAGVPHFWAETGAGGEGVTTLADLVACMRPRAARHMVEARAVGELAEGDAGSVQLVLLDHPQAPGTAEFVIAERIADRYAAPFAVRIDGESMAPEIRHGDVVILSPDCAAEPGRPAVVQLADQIGVTCKLVRFDGDRIHLIPINDAFPPTTHDMDDLQWALKVIARVRPV
ncbi:MAG: helix-turn-helix domain-containing protein [Planctomycetes bacterium]|nr:helix-turn-helix domain-containing protein [Planctomycetota bacterium]